MTRRFYPAVLERGAKETFAVWFPDFPDCVAGGKTQEQAIDKAELRLAQAVDMLSEKDLPLPEPTPFEKIALPKSARFITFFAVGVEPPDPSERVNIYLSKSLLARADRRASDLGMSRSSLFGLALTTMLGWRDAGMNMHWSGRSGLGLLLPGISRSKARRAAEMSPAKAKKSR
jgi:predicted RNase H-like HicB family nuclease